MFLNYIKRGFGVSGKTLNSAPLNCLPDSKTQGYQDGRTNIELNLAPNKDHWVRGFRVVG